MKQQYAWMWKKYFNFIIEDLSNDLPITDFYSKYIPDYKLHFKPSNLQNMNEREFLEELIAYNLENLKNTEFAPNVDFQLNNNNEEVNNEIYSKLVSTKEHESEFA